MLISVLFVQAEPVLLVQQISAADCVCVAVHAYAGLPTCICVYHRRTSCGVVTWMMVFAVTAVHVLLCPRCYSLTAETLGIRNIKL